MSVSFASQQPQRSIIKSLICFSAPTSGQWFSLSGSPLSRRYPRSAQGGHVMNPGDRMTPGECVGPLSQQQWQVSQWNQNRSQRGRRRGLGQNLRAAAPTSLAGRGVPRVGRGQLRGDLVQTFVFAPCTGALRSMGSARMPRTLTARAGGGTKNTDCSERSSLERPLE